MKKSVVSAVLMAFLALAANAQNPFVQTWFTSDPAPMVHNGRMYVYTGHGCRNGASIRLKIW